jgi:hypothetical protein
VFLPALTVLDATAAKVLGQFEGEELCLSGLTALDATTARGIAAFRGNKLELYLPRTASETAKALAEFKGRHLALNGLATLDVPTAKALAEFKGEWLSLSGLTTLDADTATALAEFRGTALALGGYQDSTSPALSVEAAKAIARFEGSLGIPDQSQQLFFRENPLTPDTARAWAALSCGQLTAVTTLDSPDSVAIAKALATRKGPLSLPNLKKLSPQTLSALLEKEDIDIPLIESLELIPEPDGSPTEDFVIPEGFQQRQKR